ncbi:MAG: hypothetical protein HYY06_11665 [Deltaproteobacteria bacterium]|nr:hypothetical protein [Deltaproteobacteria bacterium]
MPRELAGIALVCVLLRASPVGADTSPLVLLADRIAPEVSSLRGLPILRPIERGVLTRDRLLARIQTVVSEQYRPEDIRHEADLLKRLGLIPATMDYEQTMYELLREQVAGFYDHRAGRLFIASWISPEMQAPTLAHEIEHALQDQHFRIGELLRRRPGESDRQTALSALCEGDGVAVMIDYMLRGTGRDFRSMPNLLEQMRARAGGGDDQPRLRDAPRALRESLLFPYVGGLAFVRALRLAGPWSSVDAAFRAPPDSTEQILHPERFVTRDPPIAVRLADSVVLASAYRPVHHETLGELAFRLYLEETVADLAPSAAAGWGGDRVIVYERRDAGTHPPIEAVALVSRSRWDTEADAAELVQAASAALGRRYPVGSVLAVPGGAGRRIGQGLASAVSRRGADVVLLEGVPEALLLPLVTEAMAH